MGSVKALRPLAVGMVLAGCPGAPTTGQTVVQVKDEVRVAGVKRIGVALGERETWGAGQILKNLIPNPGFEAGAYGMVVHAAAGASGQRVPQDFWSTYWNDPVLGIGQPEGFWDGAEYEVPYGPAKGRTGTIARYAHENGQGVFYLDSGGTALSQWDVLFVRKSFGYLSHAGSHAFAEPGVARPGSAGSQSMRLTATPVAWQPSWTQYLDSLYSGADWKAGKLLPISGNYHLRLWAKGDVPGQLLQVKFERLGEAVFFNETIPLTTQWLLIDRTFFVPPGTDPPGPYGEFDARPALGLSVFLLGAGTQAWIDDFRLENDDQTNPTVFVDRLVQDLKALNPGILRNGSVVHGDTLDNQLAVPFGRRTHGFHPDTANPSFHSYSLHEFLELCEEVGTEPWYVFPVVFSYADAWNLVEYLAGPADGNTPYADLRASLGHPEPWTDAFAKIHLEFGNEAWGSSDVNDVFFGASLLGGTRLGSIAHDRFSVMRLSPWFDGKKIELIIGGQADVPSRQTEIEAASSAHDAVALAPYFGQRLDAWGTDAQQYYPLFAHALEDVSPGGLVLQGQSNVNAFQRGTKLCVYELNFSTVHTDTSVPLDLRNDFVTGMGGALAQPLYHLRYLSDLGIRDQCAYQVLQYSAFLGTGETVRMWGLARDLLGTGRKRPTWLGLALANEVLQGDLMETTVVNAPSYVQYPLNDVKNTLTVPIVHAFSFRDGNRRSLLLFNVDLAEKRAVQIQLPRNPALPLVEVAAIMALSIHDDNEDAANLIPVRLLLPGFANGATFQLPRHSLVKLTWLE